jgi:cytochrome c oxidase subunit II
MDHSSVGLSTVSTGARTMGCVSGTPRLRSAHLVALGALVTVLSSCSSNNPQNIFQAKGSESNKIAALNWVFWVAVAVGVIVSVAVVLVIVKFREKPGETGVPYQNHGNFKAEVTWTILPAVLLAGVAVHSTQVLWKLQDKPTDCVKVTVIGQQWWWEYSYPELGIVTANEMVLPAGRVACLSITSRDVIHSFWIPALNGKKDAVPGRVHRLRMQADEPGRYWGQCTEFCGLSHANMRQIVRALPAADFDAWAAQNAKPAAEPTDALAIAGKNNFGSLCASCHQIQGLTNDKGEPWKYEEVTALVSGAAPNLTHFAGRSAFAGAVFELYSSGDPYDPSKGELALNRSDLEAWLRNAPKALPMAPTQKRGMTNLGLNEDQIDSLVAYLAGLK